MRRFHDSGYNHEVFYRSAIKKAGKEAEDMLEGMIALKNAV